MSLKVAAWVTLACAILEFVVGSYGNSMALTTDSGYMASDACALFMAIFAYKNKAIRYYMLWLSSLMMLIVVAYMLQQAILEFNQPAIISGPGVLMVSALGLMINIWVSRGLIDMQEDHNIQVAHLHVICDMLGSAIAVVSGMLAVLGFASEYDIWLTVISSIGVGVATIVLMYKIFLQQFVLKV